MLDGSPAFSASRPPASLGDVVRLVVGDPDFAISGWRVERLSDQGIRNPEGLLLFSGGGGAGRNARQWSVVVKIIANEDADGLPQDHLWYWRREVLAFESGLLDHLPGSLSAPRCYLVEPHEDDVWVWMEHVADETARVWTSTEFTRAAYASGRFGGAYLTGRPLPDERWLEGLHAARTCCGAAGTGAGHPTDETRGC